MMRLQKFLARAGVASRRHAEELIVAGRVMVNGQPAELGCSVDPGSDEVRVDGGAPVRLAEGDVTIMLHKPAGYVTTMNDPQGRATVADLVPADRFPGLFPVGRLDKDTEGLLLLTDDGALAHDLLAPKKHVDKVYFARTEGTLGEEDCAAFAAGITLGDGLSCLPAKLELLKSGAQSEVLVTVCEGKFHQVKRMLASRGTPVIYLKRLSMGTLTLDEGLKAGEYRLLTAQEIERLRAR